MSYSIELTHNFEREFKKLYKKHPSLKNDIAKLGVELRKNPKTGVALGKECYKIRLAISSKGKGKSGGARLITHVYLSGKKIYFLSIYDKSEQDSITDKQLKALLAFLTHD